MVERISINYPLARIYVDPTGPLVCYSDYARLQEQVETLRKEQDRCLAARDAAGIFPASPSETITILAEMSDAMLARAEAAEAERDRLREALELLETVALALAESVSFDMNGNLIGGKWVGGHGGLISHETLLKVDEVRRLIKK